MNPFRKEILMRKSLVVLLVALFQCATAFQESVISGKLLGHDGKPMAMAHVHLIKATSPKPIASVEASKEGNFTISTKEKGLFFLHCTGVHHMEYRALVLIEKPGPVSLEARLGTYKYVDELKAVMIIGDFNNFDFGSAKSMAKLENGTYQGEFETKAEKFKYQIWSVEATQRSVNGTQSEAFEYDNGGDYQSVVTPKDGKAKIIFDPKLLVRSNSEPQVRFTDGNKQIHGLANLFNEMLRRGQLFSKAIAAYRASGKDMKDFKYDWSKEVSSLASSIRVEKDPLLRQMLLLSYMQLSQMGANLETEYGKMALSEIPPDSPLWAFNPFAISVAAKLSGEPGKFDEYFNAVIEKQPEKGWLANVVFNELMSAKFRNDKENLKKYYNILMERFGDTPMAKMAKERSSLESNIEVGKTMPKFSFASLDDPKTTFSESSFRGKTLLIDFWAVWCGPCIAEMENLHKAYERFKPKNFEILSLSFDPKPDAVVKFRKDKWKMPWAHVFVEKGFENETSKQFEVIGIPRPLLVDGNTGKILAMEGDLRGENLEKTLKKFLDSK